MAHILLAIWNVLSPYRTTCVGITVGVAVCQLLLYFSVLHPYTRHGHGAIMQTNELLLHREPPVNVAAATRLRTQSLAVAVILQSCDASELDSLLQTWRREVPPHLITLYYTCCNQLLTSALAVKLTHRQVMSCADVRQAPSLVSVVSDLAKHNNSHMQWYLIASRYNYVNYDLLVKFLNQLDSNQPLYLGKPVISDSTIPWRTYCAREYGVIISQALLKGLKINCSLSTHDASCLGESIWSSHHVRCWEKLSEAWSPFSTHSNTVPLKERNSLILFSRLSRRMMKRAHLTRKIAEYHKLVLKQRHTECLMNQLEHHFTVNSSLNYQENTSNIEVCLQQLNRFTITSKDDVQSWVYYSPSEAYFDQHYYPNSSAPPWKVLPDDIRRKYFTGNYTYYARYSSRMTYCIDKDEDDDDELKRTVLEIEFDDFEENEAANNSTAEETQATVHFVVTIGSGFENVKNFLTMYEQICLSTDQRTNVILVAFGNELYNDIAALVKHYKVRFPKANFTTVKGEGEFSRSRAVNLGMRELDDDDLAFFCDIGIDITDTGFLDRCRSNTIKGERVYFPEIFRHYNLSMIYRHKKQPQGFPPISRETGHWVTYGYGMVCIYKQDHLAVGRMNECIEGWGGEDNDYYYKVRDKLSIFRAPDPSLRHYWHSKNCTAITTKDKVSRCRDSSLMVLGDRIQLAMYSMENNLSNKSNITYAR